MSDRAGSECLIEIAIPETSEKNNYIVLIDIHSDEPIIWFTDFDFERLIVPFQR